jgi:hypothetical protein
VKWDDSIIEAMAQEAWRALDRGHHRLDITEAFIARGVPNEVAHNAVAAGIIMWRTFGKPRPVRPWS